MLLIALVLLQLPAPAARDATTFFRYRRSIVPPAPGQTCAILDSAIFSHAALFLKDVRLNATDATGTREIPYVVTLSEAQQSESEPARILNLGTRGHTLTFDLQMPTRPYTEVSLDLAGQDFLATAIVTGTSTPGGPGGTALGAFNLFDLTSQHLSRSSILRVQESTFPYLHIALTASPATAGSSFKASMQMIRGASVPPSREAQTLFSVGAQTSEIGTRDRESIAHIHLPERVPIERISFALAPSFHANFSREVLVTSREAGSPVSSGDSLQGTIERVKLIRGEREINDQQLSFPATLGANLQSPAEVEVYVRNGDDPPIPITAVRLEMRQRALCFQAAPGQQFTLFYGDKKLDAPTYDLARTYTPSARSTIAQLGPEQLNPNFQPRPDDRPYTERHPHLLWIALLIVVCSLALVAFRSTHPHRR